MGQACLLGGGQPPSDLVGNRQGQLPLQLYDVCGVPLIATTGGALPEVAGTSGVSALLVPPDDPGALAQAIVTAFSDESLRARLALAGRRRVAERFTWPVTARATAEQYFELLAC